MSDDKTSRWVPFSKRGAKKKILLAPAIWRDYAHFYDESDRLYASEEDARRNLAESFIHWPSRPPTEVEIEVDEEGNI